MSRRNTIWAVIAILIIAVAAYAYSSNHTHTVSAATVTIDTSSLSTSSGNPNISGSAQNASQVQVQVESENIGAGSDGLVGDCIAQVSPQGTWSCTVTAVGHAKQLTAGKYAVSATGIDSSGGKSAAVKTMLTTTLTPSPKITTQTQVSTVASSSIKITHVSGRSITVAYSGLKEIEGGWVTPPTQLYVQNEGYGSPLIKLPLTGNSKGQVIFELPANAPVGKYSITPVGIPTSKDAPCPIGDCTTGYGTTGHVVFTSFELLAKGTVTY
jgi:hypothetical protein